MRGVDLIVLTLGEQPYSEFKGNISDLTLEESQVNLAKLAQKADKPVIFVLQQGRPRLITDIESSADAIIFAGYPGQMGGEAIAALLSGRINPSAKLAFSYPKYPGHVIPYYHKSFDKSQNLYEFGHGLSYSNFRYSRFSVNDTVFSSPSDTVKIRFNISNEGDFAGDEVVLCFFRQEKGLITRPVKKLFHFDKVRLEHQETLQLEYAFTIEDIFAYPDENNRSVLEEGYFTLMIDDFSQKVIFRRPS